MAKFAKIAKYMYNKTKIIPFKKTSGFTAEPGP